jgi:hypothetical protein
MLYTFMPVNPLNFLVKNIKSEIKTKCPIVQIIVLGEFRSEVWVGSDQSLG